MHEQDTDNAAEQQPPPLVVQVWNLARSLTAFVADGCRTVDAEQYRQRLEICDACQHRRGGRCVKCGCRLALKARGRTFRCPLKKWGSLIAEQNPVVGDKEKAVVKEVNS
jgi:hypothetical protein